MNRTALIEGDCVAVMELLPEGCVDAVSADPPYGLEFMGATWDKLDGGLGWEAGAGMVAVGLGGGRPTPFPSFAAGGVAGAANATCATCGGRMRGKRRCACDNPAWRVKGDVPERNAGAAMQASHVGWLRAALRPLKPGAPLAAFSGTRTFHRLAAAMVEAGYPEPSLGAWVYGQGFNKGPDLGKLLDAHLGAEPAHAVLTTASSPAGRAWSGWRTTLRPCWEPILRTRAPGGPQEPPGAAAGPHGGLRVVHVLRKPLGAGTLAANAIRWGTGGLNLDGNRVAAPGGSPTARRRASARASGNAPMGDRTTGTTTTAEANAAGRIARRGDPNVFLAERPAEQDGRVPANGVMRHAAGCVPDGTTKVKGDPRGATGKPLGGLRDGGFGNVGSYEGGKPPVGRVYGDADGTETVIQYACVPGCPVAALDAQAGADGKKRGAAAPVKGTEPSAPTGAHGIYNPSKRPPPTQHHGAVPPVSRFWHNVAGPTRDADFAALLYDLIAPTHLDDCRLPHARGDVAGRDWLAAEPDTFHGAVAQLAPGEAPAAFAREALRVLRPGAHLMLIAPDDCPTGWRGACAWEDAGGEVRDAILYPGDGAATWFYCGKAPRSERWGLRVCPTCGPVDPKPAAVLRAEAHVEPCSRCGTPAPREEHPTVKPLALMRWLLDTTAPEGGLVLEPFAGTGTTLAAAEHHRVLGVERDPKYAVLTRSRVNPRTSPRLDGILRAESPSAKMNAT